MYARSVLTVAMALWAGSVTAQDPSTRFVQLAEQCSQIRESAENGFQGRALARPLADELEALAQRANATNELATLLSDSSTQAAECVAYVRQIPGGAVFDPEQNRYASTATIRAEAEAMRRVEEEERAALAAAEAAMQENIRQERQQALEQEINARVFEACKRLSLTDFTAAYTNTLCVQTFKENGLPEQ